MSQSRQFNDCYLNTWVAEVDANANDNGETNAASFDRRDCYGPTINVRVRNLAQNKNIAFKLQDSADNAVWADVTNETGHAQRTDMLAANNISANGGYNYFYAGEKRYIRLVVISKSAAPAAKLDVLYQKHILANKPRNTGF